nr:MAG TPA: hypothetical protein [Caudoviricetes sp.]
MPQFNVHNFVKVGLSIILWTTFSFFCVDMRNNTNR